MAFNGTVNFSINVIATISNLNLTLEATPGNSPGLSNLLQVPTLVTNPGNGGTLGFGNTLVGQTNTLPVTVSNQGTDGSFLTGNFSGATGVFGPGGNQAFNLGQGASAVRNYTYTPTSRGPNSQNVNINSNVGTSTITLQGNGVAPVSALNTAGNDAGFVLVGQTGLAGVTVTNTGDGNLSGLGAISNLNGTAQGSSGQWTLLSSPSISLPDGASTNLDYQFAPTIRGVDTLSRDINFSNGNPNNTNTAHTRTFNVTGQGVAPVSSLDTSANDAGFTLVGTSNTASVTLTNIGDGNLSGLGAISNLNGSIQTAAGEFVLVGGNSISLGDGQSQQFDYTYTPTTRGADLELLTVGLSNGSPDNMNQAHNINFQLQGQGVAPVSAPINEAANNAGFVLIGTSGTATIGITNVGDGNLSGLGAVSNLNGTVSDGAGSPLLLVGSDTFSLPDGVSQDFDYTYTPTLRGTDILNGVALFSNGSPDDTNSAHSRNYTVQGTGVAPVSTPFDQTNNNAGFTLVGTINTASVSITNIGDGNLSGLGSVSNLNGTIDTPLGEFTLQGSNSISIGDGGTQVFTYDYAPTSRGADLENGQASFINGSPDNTNSNHIRAFQLEGQGVAPVSTAFDESANNAGFTLVGTTNTATVSITNIGDGNLSGLGPISNLNGTMPGGLGEFTLAGTSISVQDGQTQSFNYVFAPTSVGPQSELGTAFFTNGSPDDLNQAHSRDFTVQGQVWLRFSKRPAPTHL